MNRSRFGTISLILVIFFLFIKIYQHNKIVKLLYKKQRIERAKAKLKKKKNNLLVELYKLKDPRAVKKQALARGMRELRPSQLVVLSHDQKTTGTNTNFQC